MTKTKTWILLAALLYLAGCATQEEPKPAPAPAPEAAPAAAPAPAPAPAPPEAVKPVAEKVRIPAQVLFDFDKAMIKPEGKSILDDLAAKARAVSIETVVVTGHADRIGSDAYNLKLSTRRADATKAYLVANGFAASRVYAEGKGEAQPVTGDKCRNMGAGNRRNRKLIACLQPDRRVEIEIIGTRAQ